MSIMQKIKKIRIENRQDIEKSKNLSNMLLMYYVGGILFLIIITVFEKFYGNLTNKSLYVNIFLLLIVTLYYMHKRTRDTNQAWSRRKISLRIFITFLAINVARSYAVRSIVDIIITIIGGEIDLNLGTVQYAGTTFGSILRVILIGPITEELLFRGVGLSLFKKEDNKLEAIVFTSIIFGLTHANFYQTINSIIGGFIYGYVAIEFGVLYSIIFHMLNNGIVYLEYFLDISVPIQIACLGIVYWFSLYGKEYIQSVKIHLNCEKSFSYKRMLAYFMDPFIFAHSIFCGIFVVVSFLLILLI